MFQTKNYPFFLEVEVYHGPDGLFSRCKRRTCVEYQPKATWGQRLPEALDCYLQAKIKQYKHYYGEPNLVSMRFVDAKSGETIREYNKPIKY